MRFGVAAALAALLLTGCQSKTIEQLSYSETKVLAKQLHDRCAAQGVPQGHSEFDACMRQEISREASIRHEAAERRNNTVVCNRVFSTVICG